MTREAATEILPRLLCVEKGIKYGSFEAPDPRTFLRSVEVSGELPSEGTLVRSDHLGGHPRRGLGLFAFRLDHLGDGSGALPISTAFSNIDNVQFLIEGENMDYLGLEGVYIGAPLSIASFH